MRTLRAEEINVKPRQIFGGKALLLLYKDARVDMDILDEEYTPSGWQRKHKEINGNLFCTIEVWDKEKGWVAKEDVGIESDIEKQKGEASDSFKRAGTNWGIGRELYTTPPIWITLKKDESKDGKKLYTKFHVSRIEYRDHVITHLEIKDQWNEIRFQWEEGLTAPTPERKPVDIEVMRKNVKAMLVEAKVNDVWRDKVLLQFDGYDEDTLDRLARAIPEKEKEFRRQELDKEAGRAF